MVDLPVKLARRVRLLSSGHGRKTDEADALSVGIATHTAPRLHTATVDEAITALRALVEHREDLVRTRTQTINRLHALVTKLVPAGLPRKLTAEAAATALRRVRPRATLGRTLRALAVELVAEVCRLDQRIAASSDQISTSVTASGTTLTEPRGNRRHQPVQIRSGIRLLLRCRASGGHSQARSNGTAFRGTATGN